MSGARFTALLLFGMTALLHAQETPSLHLQLPTANHALLHGHPEDFYQVIERNLHGVISHPWQGGQYGFVRNPVSLGGETIYTRFHEGMDIRPVSRDAHGEPLDTVHAIAAGKVVYTNPLAGASNYGRYVVVEHLWGGCPYYSLYAHLNKIVVTAGQPVAVGGQLGVMGHTGAGINRERAHVHVELNLLISDHFEEWHATFFKGEVNRHGIYNGLNLAGLDLPALFLALQKNPALTIPQFLARDPVSYKILVPKSPNFQLPRRYPWMMTNRPNESSASWEISFDRSGLALRIAASPRNVGKPTLAYAAPSPFDYRELSRDRLAGRGQNVHLTETGEHYFRLFTFPD